MTELSLLEELEELRRAGYTADFSVMVSGQLSCGRCGHAHAPHDAVIERVSRFEGESNPDDEAVVFGLRCTSCDVRGVLVTAFGPTATEDEAEVVTAMRRRPS